MKKKHITWIHIAVWSFLVLSDIATKYFYGVFSSYKGEPKTLHLLIRHVIILVGYLTIPITCFYCAYLFVAPQLFVAKKYFKAFFFFLLVVAAAILLRYSLEYYFFLPLLGFDNYQGHPWPIADFADNVFFYYFPKYFVYGLMYFFAENWYKTKHLHQELQKEKSTAELAFLRSQLNPHFLFNTLNDIYSLTYQRSEQAPEALLKLSELLRYMLREGNEDFMPLNQEIQYLETLIKLQLISAKGNAYIHFDAKGLHNEEKVASLLFVSFVENAFKHGVLNDPLNPVNIHMVTADGKITFSVNNKKNQDQKDSTGGIGLNNVKRRLELMYPNRHHLDIVEEDGQYNVNLVLQTGA
ncbi:MAG TPA: sensor histidine kinase [Mucilaginibacter sp.]